MLAYALYSTARSLLSFMNDIVVNGHCVVNALYFFAMTQIANQVQSGSREYYSLGENGENGLSLNCNT